MLSVQPCSVSRGPEAFDNAVHCFLGGCSVRVVLEVVEPSSDDLLWGPGVREEAVQP
jgi:hypothetical protein